MAHKEVFEMKEANLLVGQSGGPTTVINSSLAGVIKTAIESDKINHVYGSINGIKGVLDDNIVDLADTFEQNEEALNILKTTPSMYLGSCRVKLSEHEKDETDFQQIFEQFEKYQIKYFL